MSTVLIFFFWWKLPSPLGFGSWPRSRPRQCTRVPAVHACSMWLPSPKKTPKLFWELLSSPFALHCRARRRCAPASWGASAACEKMGHWGCSPLRFTFLISWELWCGFFPVCLFVCLGVLYVCVSFYFFSFTMFFELTRDARSPPRCGRREGREQDRELSGSAGGAGGWPDLLRVFIFPLFLYLFTRSLFLGVILP